MNKILKSWSLFFLAATSISAQKPESIYSFARVTKPVEWYKEQNSAWQSEIKKNPKNAYAWYNYYRVNRNLSQCNEADTSSPYSKHLRMAKLIDEMQKQVPNSFEYNLCKWMNGGNNMELLPYLEKAAKIGPDRPELFPEMIVASEMKGDMDRRNEYAKKWFNSGEASPGLLNYNYNVMAGLKENAILITAGDNDTYPIWILQSTGIRKDITVLNTSLLYMKEYRNRIFKKLGITDLNYDISNDTVMVWNEAQKKHRKDIMNAIVSNSEKRPVYIGLTVGEENYEFVDASLYLVGLSYEYSKTAIDNIAVMKKNFEQVYALDYLNKHFCLDMSDAIVNRINGNYLVPMIKLYEHYKLSGEIQKKESMKQLVLQIAKTCGQEKETVDYFKEN